MSDVDDLISVIDHHQPAPESCVEIKRVPPLPGVANKKTTPTAIINIFRVNFLHFRKLKLIRMLCM